MESSLDAIIDEIMRHHGNVVDRHPVFPTWSPVHAAAIIAEEAGEVVQAANDNQVARLRAECLDTIVAAIRCIEAIDRGEI